MRRKVSFALVFATGLAIGLALSGAFETPDAAVMAADDGTAPPELEELREFAGNFEKLFYTVAEEVSPAVVLIQAERTVTVREQPFPFDDMFRSPFDDLFGRRRTPQRQPRERERVQRGVGSGSILDRDGHILTNNHVVATADRLTVRLADGRSFEAKVNGTDEKTDLAVIQIQDPPDDLPVLPLGRSDDLRVGQWVLAIGNPLGLSHTVSAGIISATARSGLGVAQYESMIQTDAAINRGNSGGPLVNLHGELIGVNTAIFSPTGGSIGIGFAIPVNMAKDILDDLIAGREIVRGYLGVMIRDLGPDMAEAFDYTKGGGALVEEVQDGTPAEEAGIQAGDIIYEYDGHKVDGSSDLQRRVTATEPGDRVRLKLWRDGEGKALTVQVGNLAEAAPESSEWLGVSVETLSEDEAEDMGQPDMRGVLVTEVEDDGPVAAAGIQPGDVIVSVNRQRVTDADDFARAAREAADKDRILVRVYFSRTGQAAHLLLRRRNR